MRDIPKLEIVQCLLRIVDEAEPVAVRVTRVSRVQRVLRLV